MLLREYYRLQKLMSFTLNYADFGPDYGVPLHEPRGRNIEGAQAARAPRSRRLCRYARVAAFLCLCSREISIAA